jgi:hypothetical protein
MKTRIIATVVVVGVVCCALLFSALRVAESMHPDKTAAFAVQPGMSRHQVVESLWVLYDDYRRGRYPEVDRIILAMPTPDKVAVVCCWRIKDSADRLWVGFDKADVVIGTYIERMNP